MQYRQLIEDAYNAFNARDIDAALLLMNEDVHWPNGWQGGYVHGHNGVRAYWSKQWKEIDPEVKPVSIREGSDLQVEVEVQQKVKDLAGNTLSDGKVYHVYTFENGKIKSMEIKDAITGK